MQICFRENINTITVDISSRDKKLPYSYNIFKWNKQAVDELWAVFTGCYTCNAVK